MLLDNCVLCRECGVFMKIFMIHNNARQFKMTSHIQFIKGGMLSMYRAAVFSVIPTKLVKDTLKVSDKILNVNSKQYTINKNCYVVGFGKAVLGMATEVENILGEHLIKGIISVPLGIEEILSKFPEMQPKDNTVLEIIKGAKDNIPDEKAEEATRKISNLAQSLKSDDVLIVLISGGGSALLPYPRAPVTLQDKIKVIKSLTAKGATIQQLNCIRKKLSVLKGGGLAMLAYPAQVISLILSDVVGDPLDYIASGPTVPDTDTLEKAWDIINSLEAPMPSSVIKILTDNASNVVIGVPTDRGQFCHVYNVVIGNNSIAVKSAQMEAAERGYQTAVLSTEIQTDVTLLAKLYVDMSVHICKYLSNHCSKFELARFLYAVFETIGLTQAYINEKILPTVYNSAHSKGICLIAGGETTVHIKGSGVGGRNQHLALQFASYMYDANLVNPFLNDYNVVLLSAGTDGIDGPTNAAGAFGYWQQFEAANLQSMSFQKYLQNCDSNSFYSKLIDGEDLIVTGHTGTNVMDIQIVTIEAKC